MICRGEDNDLRSAIQESWRHRPTGRWMDIPYYSTSLFVEGKRKLLIVCVVLLRYTNVEFVIIERSFISAYYQQPQVEAYQPSCTTANLAPSESGNDNILQLNLFYTLTPVPQFHSLPILRVLFQIVLTIHYSIFHIYNKTRHLIIQSRRVDLMLPDIVLRAKESIILNGLFQSSWNILSAWDGTFQRNIVVFQYNFRGAGYCGGWAWFRNRDFDGTTLMQCKMEDDSLQLQNCATNCNFHLFSSSGDSTMDRWLSCLCWDGGMLREGRTCASSSRSPSSFYLFFLTQ